MHPLNHWCYLKVEDPDLVKDQLLGYFLEKQ